jgi:type I restriction enzyme, S subunit
MTTNTIAPRAFAVWWKDLERWDVKFYSARVRSVYPVVRLAPLIHEHSDRVKPFDYPEATFRILGVTNTGGIFHAYDSLGKKIKQPYQKVDAGDFAYNPYRVNVGSIGVVPTALGGNYISPAYVVFATDKARLLPEYLILILKAAWFNPMVRAATAGSVRQNLTFALLGTLEIPLPPLTEQKAIVACWRKAQDDVTAAHERVAEQVTRIQTSFLAHLGLKPPAIQQQPKALAVWWKDIFALSVRGTFLSVINVHLKLGKYTLLRGRDCLTEIRHGCSAPPSPKPTELEILKISAVTRGIFVPREKKYTFDNVRVRTEFDLRKGDVLLCRTNGTLAYVGMSALVLENMANLIYPDKVIRVRVKENMLPEYLWQVFQSHPIRAQIEAAARTAVGNYAIGTEDIWNLQIPVPPLAVQKQIMERVAAGREEIGRERKAADRLARDINTEVEALILGTKKVNET